VTDTSGSISRRRFGQLTGGVLASAVVSPVACALDTSALQNFDGRLSVRLKTGARTTAAGTQRLGLDQNRDAILQMPSSMPTSPMPLLVLLHGAGGSAERQLQRMGSAPSDAGVAVLAPDSRGGTWDAIRGRFGADVEFLNRALGRVFDLVAVDPARLVIGGFSDGASYALSLGLINGRLFRKIAAFSPGFVVTGEPDGKPRVFISHGLRDDILPIDRCGRVIAQRLRLSGYDVTMREFDGGHEIPPDIRQEGLSWCARA
jgi:phospholipase/carboxylesterase